MIEHLFTACFLCLGIYKSCRPGMIFHYFGYLMNQHAPKWVVKPLIGCPPCMASFWGVSYYVTYIGIDEHIIIFIFCLSGLNFFATNFFQE